MTDLIIPVVIPLAILVATLGVMYLVLQFWQHKIQRRNRRSPLTTNMLRSPAETLRSEVEELEQENTYSSWS